MAFSLFELSRFLGRKVALYTFVLGPLVRRYNTTDRELTIGGEVYKPGRGISHSAIRDTASSGKAEVKITIPAVLDPAATGTPPTQELLGWWRPYPPSSRVTVTIAETHLGDPDEEIFEVWSGRVIGPSFRDLEMVLTCDPSHSNPRTSGRARRISRNCGVPLYSQGYGMCNLDPEPIATAAVVADVTGNDVTLSFPATPARPISGGPLEWVDGNDEPQAAEIVSIDGNVFTLDDAGNLAVDDAVTVYTDPLWFVATLGVDAVGLTLTAPEFGTSPFGLEGGMIRWARDNGLVETRNILAHTGTSITIDYGHADLVAGRELRTYWGCPHNLEACTARGNAIHYPGFVWLPTDDPMGRSQAWG
ncbi:putative phage uncharacterized protein [Luteimonas sp. J16]|uniref:phage BR0599 family protein n=1 Tax=unclassified Luteimonas TaxID=2629088 RepID=UPI00047A27C1|nr:MULTISPECIES: phage BR0599 family protein [unclassified Luteimonas]TWG93570.1 putative phage uncharacterized protein [Luteimonas sp. J16]